MIPEYATRARSDKTARNIVLFVCAAVIVCLLTVMHSIDQRAYTHCVQTQTNFSRATHSNPYLIPDTSACVKAWP